MKRYILLLGIEILVVLLLLESPAHAVPSRTNFPMVVHALGSGLFHSNYHFQVNEEHLVKAYFNSSMSTSPDLLSPRPESEYRNPSSKMNTHYYQANFGAGLDLEMDLRSHVFVHGIYTLGYAQPSSMRLGAPKEKQLIRIQGVHVMSGFKFAL